MPTREQYRECPSHSRFKITSRDLTLLSNVFQSVVHEQSAPDPPGLHIKNAKLKKQNKTHTKKLEAQSLASITELLDQNLWTEP